MRFSLGFAVCISLAITAVTRGDGPADNNPDKVRRVPRLGVEPTAEQKKQLEAGLGKLRAAIDKLRGSNNALAKSLWPDVEIYYRAVHDALVYQEFFDKREIPLAFGLLDQGLRRAAELSDGSAPWTEATGLVVRGFVSRLDGSVQPYGLVIPSSYTHKGPHRFRLDIWFHGRGETLSELKFVHQRSRQAGVFSPPDTIVLHPYGRYSNAFKFAGEVDTLEALESTRRRYRVDDERTSVRGFSMGGAACWQFAVHYSDRWFGANPGAGFSETPEFLKFFQKEKLDPRPWEEKLWRWYDCNKWAVNLNQCPTVAYSGEADIQKQAADIMEIALAEKGIKLVHLIGPKTGHRYHPMSREQVDRRMTSIAASGRRRTPHRVRFATYTLKYNRMNWIRVDGVEAHWERAEVEAALSASESSVFCQTRNVTDLTLSMEPGDCPFPVDQPVFADVDGQQLTLPRPESDRSWLARLHRRGDRWTTGARPDGGLRKRHNLQGPIDDAFMDSFLFVAPTGKARNANVGKWAASELTRAIEHWRRHFRGYARVKKDTEVTEEDIARHHLILWGDPASNRWIGRVAERLPIAWNDKSIRVGDREFDAAHHALINVYPNPLNPARYVVLNSSFTFRDFAYLNNARQTAKLPDWAIIDVRTPPGNRWPGKVLAADFFDERWRLKGAER